MTCTYVRGRRFPLEPALVRPAHISIPDILFCLSRIARWAGGTDVPYSVLQHSLYVERLVDLNGRCGDTLLDAKLRALALLHDAHEALTSDIPSGVVHRSPYIQRLQSAFDRAMESLLSVSPGVAASLRPRLKRMDTVALVWEARELMPKATFLAVLGETESRLPDCWDTEFHRPSAEIDVTSMTPEMAVRAAKNRLAELGYGKLLREGT